MVALLVLPPLLDPHHLLVRRAYLRHPHHLVCPHHLRSRLVCRLRLHRLAYPHHLRHLAYLRRLHHLDRQVCHPHRLHHQAYLHRHRSRRCRPPRRPCRRRSPRSKQRSHHLLLAFRTRHLRHRTRVCLHPHHLACRPHLHHQAYRPRPPRHRASHLHPHHRAYLHRNLHRLASRCPRQLAGLTRNRS